jgi:hypothetical protein
VSSPVVLQSTLRFASRLSPGRSGSVSVCGLSPELVISLAGCEHFGGPLKSVFRVRVAALTSEKDDCLPDVSGRFCLHDDEVEFIPTFPFESDVKYHVTFDPAGLGFPVKEGALKLEFSVPSHRAELALTDVVTGHIVFLRPSHGSARRYLSNWSASEMHRDVMERDRILTRVGTGSIPERRKAS